MGGVKMTIKEMEQIIKTKIPFTELQKNNGIYEFYEKNNLSIGISYESDDDGNDIYVYNLFCNDDYINISSIGIGKYKYTKKVIVELARKWKECEKCLN